MLEDISLMLDAPSCALYGRPWDGVTDVSPYPVWLAPPDYLEPARQDSGDTVELYEPPEPHT